MLRYKNILFVGLLALPVTTFADGFGLLMLNVINENSSYNYDYYNYYDYSLSNGVDYGYSPGVGISFDSNLGENHLFGYRLNLEYYNASGTATYENYDYNGTLREVTRLPVSKKTFSLVNTFTFGLYRSKYIRLWIGPQIVVSRIDEENVYHDLFSDLGGGPALGINYNINKEVSLAVDASYNIMGDTTSTNVRAYLYWRFGETFTVRPSQVRKRVDPTDMGTRLNYLKGLRDDGVLTEEEYQYKRKQVIDAY